MTEPDRSRREGQAAQRQGGPAGRGEPGPDPHLQAALRHAPDADLRVPPLVRARIIAAAQRSADAARLSQPWWRRFSGDWVPWRMGGAGTAAAALLAATVLWVGRDEQPAAPDLRPALPVPTDLRATQGATGRTPAGAAAPAAAQAPAPATATLPAAAPAPAPSPSASPSRAPAPGPAPAAVAAPSPFPAAPQPRGQTPSQATSSDAGAAAAAPSPALARRPQAVGEGAAESAAESPPARRSSDSGGGRGSDGGGAGEEATREARHNAATQDAARAAATLEAARAAARREAERRVDAAAQRMRSESASRTAAAGEAPIGDAARVAADRTLPPPPSPAAAATTAGPAAPATSPTSASTLTERAREPGAFAGAGTARGSAPAAAPAAAPASGNSSLLDALLAGPDPAAWRLRLAAGESRPSAQWWRSLAEATRGRWETVSAAPPAPDEAWGLQHPDGRQLRLLWLAGTVAFCDVPLTRCERAWLEEPALSRLRAEAQR